MSATAAPARLSRTDRYLTVWIALAAVAGLALGRLAPRLGDLLARFEVGGISVPIATGLLVMMFPVLAAVRFDRLAESAGDRRMLVVSVLLNWVVGPALMFALAWIFLADLPEFRTGVIVVGLARCIAMVLVWNDLAGGDTQAAAFLVAINSVFQIVAFAGLAWLYLDLLPGWLGLGSGESVPVSTLSIAINVAVFLGVPLLAAYAVRRTAVRRHGEAWFEARVLPRLSPWALYGLLFTVVVLFALQGEAITSRPGDVARIALPLLVYFVLMWSGSLLLARRLGLGYERSATVAFTAAGNNFELAIAVAVGAFGVGSAQALAGVVGPLIEVPVLVGLVYVATWLRPRLFPAAQRRPDEEEALA